MRTVVTFQSNSFNTTEPREYFINECCLGDDASKWLIQRLRSTGMKTDDEPGQEDFGWYFNFTVPEGEHCLVLSYRPGDSDEEPGDWVGRIEKSNGFLGSLFGGRNKGKSPSAPIAIHAAITNAPEISNIKWHERAESDRGREVPGGSTPC